MERLDKIVATALQISRKDAISLIKSGRVNENGVALKDAKKKLDENTAELFLDENRIYYYKYVYIMMNKPKGIISASDGKGDKSVIDILPAEMKRKNLFPAGRLDKDTTGFMLITDDGEFAHSILSPKNHIPKTYIAKLDKPFDETVVKEFESGVKLKDEKCMGAKLEAADGDFCTARVEIKQGMYHQIKRMFARFGLKVVELKRIKMGNLYLDESLKEGECRYISEKELSMISDKK
ncbi:MAG: pseudouridine synthase [Eubacteriales bacterium]|nr:pseudouridine synthase [Eubacteriales bacterium]